MNADDPKWTAYALDELEAFERARLEPEVDRDVSVQMELDRTRILARQLREEMLRTPSVGLKEDQRRAIFEAQRRSQRVAAQRNGDFLRQPGVLSAMAASLLVGAGLAFFLSVAFDAQREAVRKASAGLPVREEGMRIALGRMTPSDSEPGVAFVGPGSSDSPGEGGAGGSEPFSGQRPSALIKDVQTEGGDSLLVPWKPQDGGYAWLWNRPASRGGDTVGGGNAGRAEGAGSQSIVARVNTSSSGYLPSARSLGRPPGSSPRVLNSAAYLKPSASSGKVLASSGDFRAWVAGETFPRDNPFLRVTDKPVSLIPELSSSSGLRRVRDYLNMAQVPPSSEVRIEEMLQGFEYEFPGERGGAAAQISGVLEAGSCPWALDHRLVRLAVKIDPPQESAPEGRCIGVVVDGVPARRMPLLRKGLEALVEAMGGNDQIALVTAAQPPVVLLEPTRNKKRVFAAIDRLEGAPSGGAAEAVTITMALLEKHLRKGGLNRVILAVGSDSGAGAKSAEALHSRIEDFSRKEIGLSVLALDCDGRFTPDRLKLVDAGRGNFSEGASAPEVRAMFRLETRQKLPAAAQDASVEVEFNPLHVAAYRLIGYEGGQSADLGDGAAGRGQVSAVRAWTALYEVVPTSKLGLGAASGAGLKYQPGGLALLQKNLSKGGPKELLTVKVTATLPGVSAPVAKEFVLTDSEPSPGRESVDFRFVSAVAGFGMLLRDSPYRGTANWEMVLKLASESKGADRDGARAEFVELVERARALWR
jgi:Ca-activated chloride channel family protein